jgi:hypothetical protein
MKKQKFCCQDLNPSLSVREEYPNQLDYNGTVFGHCNSLTKDSFHSSCYNC